MKGNIESQLAEDYYNNVGVGLMRNEANLGFELKAGIPLTTKDPNIYTNAVVYKVVKGDKRTPVTIISDYGNIMVYPSIEDLLCKYDIARTYVSHLAIANDAGMGQDDVDTIFCLRDRLEQQIELLTKALEGLDSGNT
jgi:hypothetical protein